MSSAQMDRAALLTALDSAVRESSGLGVLFSQAVAERVGISSSDLETLDVLHTRGPVTAGELAELTGLTSGAITGLVDRLERKGFVYRERDPHDRRRVIIHPALDSAATARIPPFYEALAQDWAAIIAGYSDDELRLYLELTQRGGDMMRRQIANIRRREDKAKGRSA